MLEQMKILGIESSCDETAAAVVEDGTKLLSNVVASSINQHIEYGGVVPEIAARSHIEEINQVVNAALSEAKCDWENIDAIGVTYGPGLEGSLLVGVLTARTYALIKNKPLIPVNHVEAHIYASFLTSTNLDNYILSKQTPEFPLLALVVSGGHTQIVYFKDHSDYKVLGATTDDAVGEAYDKVAKILGLPYPGGPSMEKLAQKGESFSYKLPKPKTQNKYDFSYSGLKTAALRLAQKEIGEDYNYPSYKVAGRLSEAQKANIAACFNHTAIEILVDKLEQARNEYNPKCIVVAGGVSASRELRRQIHKRLGEDIAFPDIKLCTDNAAMIATNAFYLAKKNNAFVNPRVLETNPNLSM